jgi:cell division protein FtsQ
VREQVIAQKVGGRVGLYGKRNSGAVAQRPAKRGGRADADATFRERLRAAASYFPIVGKVAVLLIAVVLIVYGYRAAASATFFQVRNVEVKGTSRTSSDQVQQVVRREVGQRGVWRADLAAVSAQLERLPWVRSAVVTRLLPDGLRVRITERTPRAVVRTAAGRFVWVDDDAVSLGEMSASDQMPTFFLRGWSEESSEEARRGNRERVQKYLELAREWDAAGVSERVSEVNLIDVRDIRVQLAGDDSRIEVRLGSKDAGTRLRSALNVLDGQRQTPRGALISYVDLTQGKRAVVGFTSGSQVSGDAAQTGAQPDHLTENASSPEAPKTNSTKQAKTTPRAVEKGAKDSHAAKETVAKNPKRPRSN